MKRRTYYRRYRKRTPRPAVLKQQILRKEAQKRAKYPMRIIYLPSSYVRHTRKRGVVRIMASTTAQTYEPSVLVETADLPEEEWLRIRRRVSEAATPPLFLGFPHLQQHRVFYYDKLKLVEYEDRERKRTG